MNCAQLPGRVISGSQYLLSSSRTTCIDRHILVCFLLPCSLLCCSASLSFGYPHPPFRSMKRSDITLNFGSPPGSPRTSSDFEEVNYPHSRTDSNSPDISLSWTAVPRREEELPLHYMNEESARRRVVRPQGGSGSYAEHYDTPNKHEGGYAEYDDGGKDVYSKMKAARGPVGSGRIHRPPPPPPTTIVRLAASSLLACSSHQVITCRANSYNKT